MTFDLEKARASIAHYRIENPSNVDTESALKELVDQANLAEEMLAEIERLRSAALRGNQLISELMANCNSLRARAWKAEARIKELEEALVEELATDIAYEDRVLWSRLDRQKQEEYREKAREQLQAEGKIGPDAKEAGQEAERE